jgi:hypothetical protein
MRNALKITLTINTENAAFDDHEAGEIARILRTEAKQIAGGRLGSGSLLDINGNTIGRVHVAIANNGREVTRD